MIHIKSVFENEKQWKDHVNEPSNSLIRKVWSRLSSKVNELKFPSLLLSDGECLVYSWILNKTHIEVIIVSNKSMSWYTNNCYKSESVDELISFAQSLIVKSVMES